jgi:hypothetical protein
MRIALVAAAFATASLLAVNAPTVAATGDSMSKMAGMSSGLTVPLKPQNGSGESGAATLRDTPKGLVVTIHLKNAKGPQPAHIHAGSCAKLDPKPKYPLHNVVNGMSVTTVPGVTIASLVGKTAINVHKSLTDIPTYVACGDIVK